MENRIAVFWKILGIIILIALAQIPIYFMQQYAISTLDNNYFIDLQSQAIDYANKIVDAVQGTTPDTSVINKVDNYRFVIDTLNSSYLTLALAFLWLLLIDLFKKSQLSLVNYFIVAIGLVLFYLIELVLASYWVINLAYFIAVAICAILLVGYLSGVLKSIALSVLYGIGLVLIFVLAYYLNLYVNNALAYVAICLLLIFIVIIMMTRNINRCERSEATSRGTKKLN
ncbi:inner membrane CreD family protein [Orbus mooreae]|uniref:inner membrane CreD family protein n=1 Tax=Orbus mooreae TaxID=3074107 RepID=UPI00370D4018